MKHLSTKTIAIFEAKITALEEKIEVLETKLGERNANADKSEQRERLIKYVCDNIHLSDSETNRIKKNIAAEERE